MEKILIGIPTSDKKNYCWKEFSEALKGQTYGNMEILFVDNSKDQHNRHFIRKQGFECAYINPRGKDIKQVMAESHDLLRQEAIKRNADLFHVESDIILPPMTIETLLSHQKDIIGFPYFIGFGKETRLMVQVMEEYGNNKNVIYPDDIMLMDGTVKPFFHIGLGAILIANYILPKFKFRYNKNNETLHPDTNFAEDMFRLGHTVWCDTSKVITHLNRKYWSVLSTEKASYV